ncbi:hypothetical protein [Bifidobacterium tissieri]|uniref:Uncharacterized protein n=1 Tax=Bifidobacterium tissieri TaxID=1630162 RepID=A0A5M9ZPB2_9BIFI|nr:hypothetical protein [Bifidobacterium tissieri]KAA8829335.1 hypothetical protein EM849_11045 [Bifidobacterium tissieri]KAA8831648.1 hypothetical protein EMO89_02685 [Bifidobacterium tissieri]
MGDYLYDGQTEGFYLYEGEEKPKGRTLLDTDTVVVQNRRRVIDAYGGHYEPDGEPIEVVCNVEGRAQQAGQFSISGQESKKPNSQGGLTEVTPVQILAREWPGDIHSTVWIHPVNPDMSVDESRWDKYDADGAPVYRRHGSRRQWHWECRARRVVDSRFSDTSIGPYERWVGDGSDSVGS